MEEEKKDCKSCKKGFDSTQKTAVAISIYLLITSVYGNVKLFQYIASLF